MSFNTVATTVLAWALFYSVTVSEKYNAPVRQLVTAIFVDAFIVVLCNIIRKGMTLDAVCVTARTLAHITVLHFCTTGVLYASHIPSYTMFVYYAAYFDLACAVVSLVRIPSFPRH
jgi:hypothetical protein